MKKIFYFILSLILVAGLSVSCSDWLDVNTDPDNPNNLSASVNNRLSWVQYYYMYGWGTANTRASFIDGVMTLTSTTNGNGLLAAWNPTNGSSTTTYQNWFLGAATNIPDLITKAEASESYSYIGAANVMHAMGYMMMVDLYGEMPYTDAISSSYAPKYDDGETIYKGCFDHLNTALADFAKTDGAQAVALAEGDIWCGGDKAKWVKLAYGLKARWMTNASKKTVYNADSVLAYLAKAPQSNADNIVMKQYNVEGDALNFTVGDPYQANVTWCSTSYGVTQRLTRWYVNQLTNSFTGGSKVIDPRYSKMVPAAMTNVKVDKDGSIQSYGWNRDAGVDMLNSDIRQNSGPMLTTYASAPKTLKYYIKDASARQAFADAQKGRHDYSVKGDTVEVTYATGCMYVNNTNYKRAGDTAYVTTRSNSMSTGGKSVTDENYYLDANKTAVGGTGMFYTRPDSDSEIMTYSEMCFIKAEAYFRKGDKANAYKAYIDGIKADFEKVQAKLNEWKSEGFVNPDQMPMKQSDIDAYMSSAAVCQSSGSLTMADIMRQKLLSMPINLQTWNDIRRFNYSAGNIKDFGVVYPDLKRPYEFTATNKMTGTSPKDENYWFRRLNQSAHEWNYNIDNLKASNPLATTDAIYSCPVWWDTAE